MQKRYLKWLVKNFPRIYPTFFTFLLVVISPQAMNLDTMELVPLELENLYKHTEEIAKKEDGTLITESFQIEKTKLDSERNEYIIILYMIEGMNQGNNHEVRLAIFEVNTENKMKLLTDLEISHRLHGIFEHFEIKENKIVLYGLKAAKMDALCCPSIPISITLELKAQKLVLLDGKFLTDFN